MCLIEIDPNAWLHRSHEIDELFDLGYKIIVKICVEINLSSKLPSF
jgi:hypothetical protein